MIREGMVSGAEYPHIQKTAAGLNVGEASGLIREEDGFHIVKVKGIQAQQDASCYEEARELILSDLRKRRKKKAGEGSTAEGKCPHRDLDGDRGWLTRR